MLRFRARSVKSEARTKCSGRTNRGRFNAWKARRVPCLPGTATQTLTPTFVNVPLATGVLMRFEPVGNEVKRESK
jgi:hypothetical protein